MVPVEKGMQTASRNVRRGNPDESSGPLILPLKMASCEMVRSDVSATDMVVNLGGRGRITCAVRNGQLAINVSLIVDMDIVDSAMLDL